MNQKEFLEQLEEELKYLKYKEIIEVVNHYRDRINVALDYGESEEKVIKNFPNPKMIAEEIYKGRGIAYIDIKKRQYRRKEILNAIIGLFICLISIVIFSLISFFIFSILNNLGIFLINFWELKSIIDRLLSILFIIMYILIIGVAYIYIIDLFYIIVSYFIERILKIFKKYQDREINITNFSISGFLNKVFKKEKVLLKILGIFTLILLFSAFSGYFTKSYIYRSLNNRPNNEQVIIINDSFSKIVCTGDELYVQVINDNNIDKPQVSYQHEFKKILKSNVVNDVLYIGTDEYLHADFLDLIKEPVVRIILSIPNNYHLSDLDININNGIVAIGSNKLEVDNDEFKVNIDNVKISMDLGTITINQSIINTTNISARKAEIVTYYSLLNNLDTEISSGSFIEEGSQILNFILDSGIANVSLSKSFIDELNFNSGSGKAVLKDIIGNVITFSSYSSINNFVDLNYNIINLNLLRNCKLDMDRVIATKSINAKVNNSYLTINYGKSPTVDIDNNSGNVKLFYLGKNIDNIPEENNAKYLKYNEYVYDIICDLSGEGNPIYGISDNNLKELYVIHNNGGLTIQDSIIQMVDMILENVTVDLDNIYGNKITLRLMNCKVTFFNDIEDENLIFICKRDFKTSLDTNVSYTEE